MNMLAAPVDHQVVARGLRRMLAKLYRSDLKPLRDGGPALSGRPGSALQMCPSSTPESGGKPLAVIDADGRADYAVPVQIGRSKDGVVRLAGRCVQSGCAHWIGFCRLGAAAASAAFELGEAEGPQDCPITATCRWRAENGSAACVLCPWLHRVEPQELIDAHEGKNR